MVVEKSHLAYRWRSARESSVGAAQQRQEKRLGGVPEPPASRNGRFLCLINVGRQENEPKDANIKPWRR